MHRDRITIQRGTTTNTGGTPVTTYTALFSRIAASVEDVSASRVERLFGARVSEVRPRLVTLAHQPALDAIRVSDRVVWHSTTDVTMEIVGMAVQGRWRGSLVLLVEERRG